MFVGAKGGNVGDKPVNYQSHTASSAKQSSGALSAQDDKSSPEEK